MAVKTVREFMAGREEEQLRHLTQAVNGLQNGQGNNAICSTLKAGDISTTVPVAFAIPGIGAMISATTAAMATAIAAGVLWVEVKQGEIVIHSDAAAADREICVVLVG